jgi:hypothetical protein
MISPPSMLPENSHYEWISFEGGAQYSYGSFPILAAIISISSKRSHLMVRRQQAPCVMR